MHVASCSKLITAMAMTKLLNDKQFVGRHAERRFLPGYWAKGPNVNTTRPAPHDASGPGWPEVDSDFAYEERAAVGGVAAPASYMYQNMNFGLCRILIATINGNIAPAATFNLPFIPNSKELLWDVITITPTCSTSRTTCNTLGCPGRVSTSGGTRRGLQFPVQAAGWGSGDRRSMSGGAGWQTYLTDRLKPIGAFGAGGTIMSAAAAQRCSITASGRRAMMPLGIRYNKKASR